MEKINHFIKEAHNSKPNSPINNKLKNLAKHITQYNLYIKSLTKSQTNTLYESLFILKMFDNYQELKDAIFLILIVFRKQKYFVSTHEESLEEIFNMNNTIEYVWSAQTNSYYKYNYDVMCIDVLSPDSLNRVPLILILKILSVVLDISINIYTESTNIYVKNNDNNIVSLGMCGFNLFVPLDKI